MGEGEANEIGLAALELAECRKKLACLKTRAERFRKEIDRGAEMLKDCLLPRATNSKGQSPSEDGWPSYDDLAGLHKSYEATSARIRELEGRFRDWGVLPEQRRTPN